MGGNVRVLEKVEEKNIFSRGYKSAVTKRVVRFVDWKIMVTFAERKQ